MGAGGGGGSMAESEAVDVWSAGGGGGAAGGTSGAGGGGGPSDAPAARSGSFGRQACMASAGLSRPSSLSGSSERSVDASRACNAPL